MSQESLFDLFPDETRKPSGPVTCLGMTFENYEKCRETSMNIRHYIGLDIHR